MTAVERFSGSQLRTSAVVGVLALLLALLSSSLAPAYNWDLLAYAAIALDEGDEVARHERLWNYVDRDIPVVAAARLRGESPDLLFGERSKDTLAYRRATAMDARAFSEQLPFYSVKPMYPAMIAAVVAVVDSVMGIFVGDFDLGPVRASVMVAKVSWIFLGVALFCLLRLRFSNLLAFVGTLSMMTLPLVQALHGYSTPDALSATMVLLGFVLALRDPSRTWTMASAGVVFLALAVRPDNLLLLGVFLTWFLWNSRVRFRWAVLVGMAGVLWCLILSELSGNYGWSVLLHHSFIDYLEYPSTVELHLSLTLLWDIYLSKLSDSPTFFKFLGAGLLLAGWRLYMRGPNDRLFQAVLVLLVFMVEHWLLFPDQKDRLLVASYLFILSAGLFCLADQLAGISWLREIAQNEPTKAHGTIKQHI